MKTNAFKTRLAINTLQKNIGANFIRNDFLQEVIHDLYCIRFQLQNVLFIVKIVLNYNNKIYKNILILKITRSKIK